MIKKIIPPGLRLGLRVLQKNLMDLSSGHGKKMIDQHSLNVTFPPQLQISQPIRPNQYSDNKIHNLRLATAYIENKSIAPGQILSFWKLIPRPVKANGFKKGRNLIGDGLSTGYGGGLCQLSGILYHLSLLAGLHIVERHPHSKDIYTEATRFTPLGSDATVVYGYKDLRVQNCLDHPISFSFKISDTEIIAECCAAETLEVQVLTFEAIDQEKQSVAKVYVMRDREKVLISEDVYWKLGK